MLAHTRLLVSTQLVLTGSERAASVQRLQQPSVLMPEVVVNCTIRCITVISGQTRAWRCRNTSERGTDIGCLLPAAHAICIHSELLPTQLEHLGLRWVLPYAALGCPHAPWRHRRQLALSGWPVLGPSHPQQVSR